MLVLFVVTIAFFPLDRPYWWISILTFFLIIIITLTKIMWEISRRTSDQINRLLGNDNVTISYTIED